MPHAERPVGESKKDYFERRKGNMKNERSSFISHYRDLSDFIQPRRGRFSIGDRNKGDKRWNNIINSRGTQAVRVARGGMVAGTFNPSRPWFNLETIDPDLMDSTQVKIWLHKVEQLIYAILNTGNFYNMAPVLIDELLTFGTGFMLHVDDRQDLARFYTSTAGSYMIAQNARYEVDTFCREFEMTAEQMVQQFGYENVSISVQQQLDKGNRSTWYPVVHFVEPNPDLRLDSPLAKDLPFRSIYYEPGNNLRDQFLSESGFHEFPAYVPRWDVTGEDVYATNCPGMTALGDIKMLQIEEKRKAQGIDKVVNPPLVGPASVRNVPVSSLPGGLTVYDIGGGTQKLEPLYNVQLRLGELIDDMDRVERRINEAFYVDMFLAISNMEGIQPRNQLDLSQRNEERLLQLGPVLERVHNEFLSKLVDRVFNQAVRAGLIGDPPPDIAGQELKVKFISSLAMAQKAVATQNIERVAGYVSALIGAGFTNVTDKFNADKSVEEFAQAIGIAPEIIVSDEEVQEIRAARAEAQAQREAVEMAQGAASAAESASKADLEGDNVLTQLADTVQPS